MACQAVAQNSDLRYSEVGLGRSVAAGILYVNYRKVGKVMKLNLVSKMFLSGAVMLANVAIANAGDIQRVTTQHVYNATAGFLIPMSATCPQGYHVLRGEWVAFTGNPALLANGGFSVAGSYTDTSNTTYTLMMMANEPLANEHVGFKVTAVCEQDAVATP